MDAFGPPSAKTSRQETNFCLCIICQQKTDEELVKRPTSHQNVIDIIRERAGYGDGEYPEIDRRLRDSTADSLKAVAASWHRSCYQNTCHRDKCKRAKERFEQHVFHKANPKSGSSHTPLDPSTPTTSASAFTRSKSKPYNSDVCFFCDGKSTKTYPLFKVRTDEAFFSFYIRAKVCI